MASRHPSPRLQSRVSGLQDTIIERCIGCPYSRFNILSKRTSRRTCRVTTLQPYPRQVLTCSREELIISLPRSTWIFDRSTGKQVWFVDQLAAIEFEVLATTKWFKSRGGARFLQSNGSRRESVGEFWDIWIGFQKGLAGLLVGDYEPAVFISKLVLVLYKSLRWLEARAFFGIVRTVVGKVNDWYVKKHFNLGNWNVFDESYAHLNWRVNEDFYPAEIISFHHVECRDHCRY